MNFGRIDDYPHEQWARIIDVNLTGVFNGIKAAAPVLARVAREAGAELNRRSRRERDRPTPGAPAA